MVIILKGQWYWVVTWKPRHRKQDLCCSGCILMHDKADDGSSEVPGAKHGYDFYFLMG